VKPPAAALLRRLDEIELALAAMAPAPKPDNPLPWLSWTTEDELLWLDGVNTRWQWQALEPTPAEHARILEIEARCCRAMLDGEPDWCTQQRSVR
jgi:hypothetical protein